MAWLEDASGRKRRAADHMLDVLRDDLLVADPVLHRANGALGERRRGRLDRRGRVHALRRDDPEVARRQLGRFGRRLNPADDLARAGQAQSAIVDRRNVLAVEIERPDLDVLELSQVGREQRPDRSAANDRHPHRYEASRPLTRR